MKPHKHAEVIKAWADGHEIEMRIPGGCWERLNVDFPHWDSGEYRIKPERMYPITMLEPEQLRAEYNSDFQGTSEQQALVRVVNFALRHAIDAGQLVDPRTYMADVRELAANRNARRDMAIARAVENVYCKLVPHKQLNSDYYLECIIATVNERK